MMLPPFTRTISCVIYLFVFFFFFVKTLMVTFMVFPTQILEKVKVAYDLPIVTDVHEAYQVYK